MDAQQRFEFFEFVRGQWGPDRAGQLMDLLPPAGAAELVTTDQLERAVAGLRGEMHEGFARISERMAEQSQRIAEQSQRIADTTRLIAETTRTLMIAMITLWASGIALAFTAARLAG